ELVDVVVAEGGSQFCARQGRVGGQFDRGRLVLEGCVLVEQFIDPNRQRESRAIENMILKSFAWLLVGTWTDLVILPAPILLQKRVDFGAPVAIAQNLRRTHFAG